jgi:predicted protein tyrosine phosphatase
MVFVQQQNQSRSNSNETRFSAQEGLFCESEEDAEDIEVGLHMKTEKVIEWFT